MNAVAQFSRDRFTWIAYLLLAYYAYFQGLLGPAVPFLRAELNLNYTVTGMHVSAFAIGMSAAGLLAEPAARRFGRHFVFWAGGAGMVLGSLVLAAGQHPAVTIGGSLIMGVLGSFLLVMIQSTLSDRHGVHRAIALTEANVAASVAATLGPLVMGLGVALGLGWRFPIAIGIVVWVLIYLVARSIPIPQSRQPSIPSSGDSDSQSGRLSRAYWAYWLVLLAVVAIEWSMMFWGADFLENVVKLPRNQASTMMSVFFGAMIIGRFAGSRLTRRYSAFGLLPFAIGLVAVGFPPFWLGQVTWINLTGLFICGLGIANLFPLTLSALTTLGENAPDKASGRASFAAGLSMLVMPQLLGIIADIVGIFNAYSMMVVLLLAVSAAVFAANRLQSQ